MFAQLKKDYLKGWATAAQQMSQAKDYSHTIFGPKFHQELREGYKGKAYGIPGKDRSRQYTVIPQRDPIKIEENPVQFAGAMGARFLTDIGTDSTRRFYWHYNHPLPIADKVAEQIIGADAAAELRPAGLGGKGSSTATLVFGGSPPSPSYNAATEEWNGASWVEVADLNTARLLTSGAAGYTSTTTAGLAFGGEIAPGTVQSATEEWNSASDTVKTLTD